MPGARGHQRAGVALGQSLRAGRSGGRGVHRGGRALIVVSTKAVSTISWLVAPKWTWPEWAAAHRLPAAGITRPDTEPRLSRSLRRVAPARRKSSRRASIAEAASAGMTPAAPRRGRAPPRPGQHRRAGDASSSIRPAISASPRKRSDLRLTLQHIHCLQGTERRSDVEEHRLALALHDGCRSGRRRSPLGAARSASPGGPAAPAPGPDRRHSPPARRRK